MSELRQTGSGSSPPWSLRTKRTVALIILILIGLLVWRLSDIWPPVVVAAVLAYLLSPIVSFFERLMPFIRRGSTKRWIAVFLTLVVVITLIVLVMVLIIPPLISQFEQFSEGLPELAERMAEDVNEFLEKPISIGPYTFVPQNMIEQSLGVTEPEQLPSFDLVTALQNIVTSLFSPVVGVVSSAVNGIIWAVFVITLMVYMMSDGPRFLEEMVEFSEPEYRDDVRNLLREIGVVWNAYLRGQLILCATMGVVVFITASILGVRSPLVLGTISALLEFIPNLGPALALVPAATFAFFFPSSTIPGLSGPLFALVVIVAWTALQNIEAVLLVPRVMGGSLNLHPLVVLVAVLAGASLGGALGVILAAPVVATVRVFSIYIYRKLKDQDPFPLSEAQAPPEPAGWMVWLGKVWDKVSLSLRDFGVKLANAAMLRLRVLLAAAMSAIRARLADIVARRGHPR